MPIMNKSCLQRANFNYKLSSVRDEDKSIEFVLATETPAMVADWENWEMVREVLVSSGLELPETNKIPLQDSHNRNSISDNLGHVAEIRVENDKVVGRLYFDADDENAMKAYNKVKKGHLDSGSIGYNVLEKQRISENEILEYNGKSYKGKLQLSTRWRLEEFSIVAIGADPFAKARSNNLKENKEMRKDVSEEPKVQEKQKIENSSVDQTEQMQREAKEKLELAERKLTDASIIELCARYGLQTESKSLIEKKASFEEAQKTVIDALSAKTEKTIITTEPEISMGATDGEKMRKAIVDAIVLRSGRTMKDVAAGAENFRNRSLIEIGTEIIEKNGVSTRGMTRTEIARMLLGKKSYRSAVATDMTTASFSYITEDVVSKSAMNGFMAQGHVWNQICKIGSVPDFKTVTRVGLSENCDLRLKKEGAEYRESKFSDRKESGLVGTYADKTTLTEEALINDDISVLTDIPFRKGAAAMRVPETLLFAAINTPPTLTATSLAWFSSSNDVSNDMNDADGLNSTNLSAAIAQMKTVQAPVNDNEEITDYLDLQPQILLVHPLYEMTARILTGSASLPETTMSSGVINPLRDANLVPLSSGRLTTNSSFYLFANPQLYPVAEMLFLDGRVAPESFLDESTNIDGLTYRIRIRVGFIPLEWRTVLRFRKA